MKKNPLGKIVFQKENSYLSHDELKTVDDYLKLKLRKHMANGVFNIDVEQAKMCIVDIVNDLNYLS